MTNAQILEQVAAGKIKPADAAKLMAPDKFKLEIGAYNGSPTLKMHGNYKPVTMGVTKFEDILDHADEIRAAIVAARKACGQKVAAA